MLKSDANVHQFKINSKAAYRGDVWEWHQDYIFWQREDGMPTARVVNAVVFLDDVNEFNGPLLLIPTSHHLGVIDVPAYDPRS
jgi:ectoine hydroxylase